MVLGIFTAILMALACGMFLLKYCPPLKKALYQGRRGKRLLALHEVLGFLLLGAAALHLATSWKLLRQRPLATYITGVAMVVCIALAVGSFLLRGRWGKWKTLHHAASGLLIVLVVVHILCGVVSFGQYTAQVNALEITSRSAQGVPDGAYTGECSVGYIYAKVRVEVRGEKLTEVTILEHRNERGGAAEAVAGAMVQAQNVRVDAVSGATNSSRVIMKAAENALEGAGRQ